VLGGGPFLGVVSKSKAEGIHTFAKKTHYNEWFFIYVPAQLDTGLSLPKGPFDPDAVNQMAGGAGTNLNNNGGSTNTGSGSTGFGPSNTGGFGQTGSGNTTH
jgi:hypothetical protein